MSKLLQQQANYPLCQCLPVYSVNYRAWQCPIRVWSIRIILSPPLNKNLSPAAASRKLSETGRDRHSGPSDKYPCNIFLSDKEPALIFSLQLLPEFGRRDGNELFCSVSQRMSVKLSDSYLRILRRCPDGTNPSIEILKPFPVCFPPEFPLHCCIFAFLISVCWIIQLFAILFSDSEPEDEIFKPRSRVLTRDSGQL